jgi:hypothetical protein
MMVSERAEEKHEASLAMLRADIEAQREAANTRAVAQIVSRWLEVNKSKCFLQWHWWAQTMVSQRQSLSSMLLRLTQGCLFNALSGWRESAHELKRQKIIIGRVVARMRHVAVLSAFSGWSECAQWRISSRKIVHRMVSRMGMREVTLSFFAWCDHVDQSYRRPRSEVCRT